MRYGIHGLAWLMLGAALQGCTLGTFIFDDDPEASVPPLLVPPGELANPPPGGPSLYTLVAYDSTGVELGYVLMGAPSGLVLITAAQHVYQIYWNGSFVVSEVYFVGAGCSGNGYFQSGGALYTSKMVVAAGDGSLWLPAQDNGGVTVDGSLVVGSKINESGSCVNGNVSMTAIELTETTHSFLGIPAVISSPIEVEEE